MVVVSNKASCKIMVSFFISKLDNFYSLNYAKIDDVKLGIILNFEVILWLGYINKIINGAFL